MISNKLLLLCAVVAPLHAQVLFTPAESGGGGASAAWTPELDLNEKLWLDWNADDLADGAVATWADAAGGEDATQATGANQPTKDATGVIFTGTDSLSIPFQTEPWRAHRAVVIIFKAAVDAATHADGFLFSFNGQSGTASHRSPGLVYDRVADTYMVQWGATETNGNTAVAKGDDADWHVIIARRVDGQAFASIDGGAEVASAATNLVLWRDTGAEPVGIIGDVNATGIDWTLKRLMVIQGELTDDEVDRIAGWAMWSVDQEADLPMGHPYRDEPPVRSSFTQTLDTTSYADFQAIETWWDATNIGNELETNYGDAIAPLIAGLSEVFRDDFTSDTITDEITGTGPWYAPVHNSSTAAAQSRRPAQLPDVYTQSGSEVVITMQESAEVYYSGAFQSTNLDGRGNTWNPADGPLYIEASVRASPGNDIASWPAILVKGNTEYFYRTTTRLEIDIVEQYNVDPTGHHQSLHLWPALRNYGGRLDSHEYTSNYTGMVGGTPWGATDLFDNAYHEHGLYIDSDWMIYTFDGLELSRTPTLPDFMQPLHILVSLAMLQSEAASASGNYELGIDWIRVLQ
jgi:hypothetical protein